MKRSARVVTCLLAITAAPLSAQSLTDRIERAPGNTDVTFTFPSDPEVCGYRDAVIRFQDDSRRGYSISYYSGDWNDHKDIDKEEMRRLCRYGPARVILDRSGGEVRRVHVRVGADAPDDTQDLGEFTAQQAYTALADIAREGSSRARNSALAAMLVGADPYWPTMLALAKDRDLERDVRKQAVFWLGQAAGEKATEGLRGILADDSDEIEIRKQAVFALSQQRNDEAVTTLIEVAQTSKEPEIRKNALFWLGQREEDPRVVALFEKILLGR